MKFQEISTVVIASILLGLLAGCSNTVPPTEQTPPEGEVLAVRVTPAQVTLEVQESRTMTATVDSTGDVDTGVIWTSEESNGTIFVESDGTVVANAPGQAQVVAISRHDPAIRGSATVVVRPRLEVIGDYDGYMYANNNRSPILLTVEAGPNAQEYSVILDFVDGGAIRHQCGPIANDSTIDCNAVDGVGTESTLRGTFDGDTFDGTYRLRDRQGNVVLDATFETEKR